MTDSDLDELERLHAAATPGKWLHRDKLDDGSPACDVLAIGPGYSWSIVCSANGNVSDVFEPQDAALIAGAANALPALIAAARERDGLAIYAGIEPESPRKLPTASAP